ncbi:MAG: hypothetical protein RLZZ04_3057 [Cyanobacteriota bacterium]
MVIKKLLLIVEDSFYLHSLGLGLVVLPEVPKTALQIPKTVENISLPVILKYPDGKIQNMKAQFQVMHFNPGGFKILCGFSNTKIDTVPVGTEIWIKHYL